MKTLIVVGGLLLAGCASGPSEWEHYTQLNYNFCRSEPMGLSHERCKHHLTQVEPEGRVAAMFVTPVGLPVRN